MVASHYILTWRYWQRTSDFCPFLHWFIYWLSLKGGVRKFYLDLLLGATWFVSGVVVRRTISSGKLQETRWAGNIQAWFIRPEVGVIEKCLRKQKASVEKFTGKRLGYICTNTRLVYACFWSISNEFQGYSINSGYRNIYFICNSKLLALCEFHEWSVPRSCLDPSDVRWDVHSAQSAGPFESTGSKFRSATSPK
jgi:hypothetical protein